MSVDLLLSPEELRIIGCLMEKAVITPDQYPLTLNALRNACNQKSSRDPVMSLVPGSWKEPLGCLSRRHSSAAARGKAVS